jgi:hypothetical protein
MMESMNNEHEKKVSIWYVIGNADLGLGKSFDSVEVENLRHELVNASLDKKFEFFIDKTRTEDPHHRSSPFLAACQIVEKYLNGVDTSTTRDFVLVSTQQSPEHPQDTWLIGDALCNVIKGYPDDFTKASLRSRHVIVDDLSIDAFAERINADIDTNGHGDINIFISGGGATTTAIGVVGGLLEAGVRPIILESNHQDDDDVLKFSECRIDPRIERWLSRTRRYHLLADLVQEEDQKHALRALHASLSLDWSVFYTEVALIKAPKLKAKIRELDVPRNGERPKVPKNADDFSLYRAALARTLNSLIAEDEMIASRYLAQYISMSTGEVAAVHKDDAKVVRQNGRIAVENKKIKSALKKFKFADYKGIRKEHPNADAETLVAEMVKQSKQGLVDLVKRQIENVSESDLAEVLYSDANRGDRNAVPKSLRPFLERKWMELWDIGSTSRHVLQDAPEMRSLLKNIDFSSDNIEDEILEYLGFPLPRRMNSELQLVLFPLGKSNVGSDDPMLEAVHDGLMGSSEVTNWNNVHFVLVTSQDTSLVGDSLRREVENWGCRSVTSVMCENPFEVGAVQQTLLSFLDQIDSSAIRSVHSCFAPGTKGTNLGLALSSIQFSFEAATDFTLWSVVPGETVDGRRRSRLVRSDVGVSGWQNLIPEEIVAELLVDALQKFDFSLAESLLESSPRKWEHSRKLLADFIELVNGSSQQKKIKKICREYELNHESLLINRLRLILGPITTGRATDAMKENVIRAALVLEDYGKSGEGDWWRDKDEMPLGYALWRWRTEALHDSWSTIDVSNEFTVRNFCMELGFDEEAVRNVFAEPNPLQVLRDSISKPAGATMGVDS